MKVGKNKTHFCHAGSEVASDQELVPLELGLDDDEGEVGLGVHVARHVLDLFDLGLYPPVDALEESSRRPADFWEKQTSG